MHEVLAASRNCWWKTLAWVESGRGAELTQAMRLSPQPNASESATPKTLCRSHGIGGTGALRGNIHSEGFQTVGRAGRHTRPSQLCRSGGGGETSSSAPSFPLHLAVSGTGWLHRPKPAAWRRSNRNGSPTPTSNPCTAIRHFNARLTFTSQSRLERDSVMLLECKLAP